MGKKKIPRHPPSWTKGMNKKMERGCGEQNHGESRGPPIERDSKDSQRQEGSRSPGGRKQRAPASRLLPHPRPAHAPIPPAVEGKRSMIQPFHQPLISIHLHPTSTPPAGMRSPGQPVGSQKTPPPQPKKGGGGGVFV